MCKSHTRAPKPIRQTRILLLKNALWAKQRRQWKEKQQHNPRRQRHKTDERWPVLLRCKSCKYMYVFSFTNSRKVIYKSDVCWPSSIFLHLTRIFVVSGSNLAKSTRRFETSLLYCMCRYTYNVVAFSPLTTTLRNISSTQERGTWNRASSDSANYRIANRDIRERETERIPGIRISAKTKIKTESAQRGRAKIRICQWLSAGSRSFGCVSFIHFYLNC